MLARFDLPIDKSLANAQKAAELIDRIKNPPDGLYPDGLHIVNGEKADSAVPPIPHPDFDGIDWSGAKTVESTRAEVTVDEKGYMYYGWDTEEYGSMKKSFIGEYSLFFTDDGKAETSICAAMKSEGPDGVTNYAIRADKAADGTVTAVIVVAQ
jgi:hypothetical protein